MTWTLLLDHHQHWSVWWLLPCLALAPTNETDKLCHIHLCFLAYIATYLWIITVHQTLLFCIVLLASSPISLLTHSVNERDSRFTYDPSPCLGVQLTSWYTGDGSFCLLKQWQANSGVRRGEDFCQSFGGNVLHFHFCAFEHTTVTAVRFWAFSATTGASTLSMSGTLTNTPSDTERNTLWIVCVFSNISDLSQNLLIHGGKKQ